MDKSGEVGEPISSHDTEKLKEYFDKHLRNPAEDTSFKIIMLFDRLIEHKFFLVRWISMPFALIFGLGYAFHDWWKYKRTGRSYWE